jgi:hypothetical protein
MAETPQSPRPTSDGEFVNAVVRIADLTVINPILDGLTFSNCRILGPAVLLPMENVNVHSCQWDTPDPRALIWPLPEEGTQIVGAVGVRNCTFSRCSFAAIGMAGKSEFVKRFLASFGITS